jgi:hypothetical protein
MLEFVVRYVRSKAQEGAGGMTSLSGRCLCGGVTYTCVAEPVLTVTCHCPSCQRQTGTSFSLLVAVPNGSLNIRGRTLKTFDDIGASGLPVRRHFCGNCGSPIVQRLDAMPTLEFIKAGTLDDTSWVNPTMEIWCDTAQAWLGIDRSREIVQRNPPAAA